MTFLKKLLGAALLALAATTPAEVHEVDVAGRVVDINGRPVPRAIAILERGSVTGASVVTVFAGDDGYFRFPPDAMPVAADGALRVTRLGLGYESVDVPLSCAAPKVVVLPRTHNSQSGAAASRLIHAS